MESAQQPFTASPPLRPSSPAEEDTTPVALDAAHTTSLACIPGVEKSTIQGILRLPDDILGEISLQSMVSYLKTDDAFGDQLGAHFCDLYDCFAVSHVCRRWKYAALATPCAWATIKLSKSTDCISAMIERSGQVPLLVYEDTFLWDDNVTASKELVFQEMHRIMHLRILVDNKVCDFLSNLEVADAPLLKTLHLTYSEHYDEQPFDSIPALSSWAMPSLVHLSIHDKSEWDGDGMPELTLVKPLLRSTITELEIDELKTPIPVEACLDLLHGLPMLKRLTFGGVLSRPQGNLGNLLLPVADNIVSLCHLRNFSFQRTSRWSHRDQMDLGVGAAELLRHLDIPASTSVYFLADTSKVLSSDGISFIFSVLRSKVTSTNRNETSFQPLPFLDCIINICTDFRSAFEVQLRSAPRPIEVGYANCIGSPQSDQVQTLHVAVCHQYFRNTDAIPVFFSHGFPLSTVSTIRLYDSAKVVEPEHWTLIFDALPEVQEVFIGGLSRSFLRAIETGLCPSESTAEIEPGGSGVIRTMLPNLTALRLGSADQHQRGFAAGGTSRGECNRWENEPFVGQLIRTLSKWRTSASRKGHALKDLMLASSMWLEDAELSKLESSGITQRLRVL